MATRDARYMTRSKASSAIKAGTATAGTVIGLAVPGYGTAVGAAVAALGQGVGAILDSQGDSWLGARLSSGSIDSATNYNDSFLKQEDMIGTAGGYSTIGGTGMRKLTTFEKTMKGIELGSALAGTVGSAVSGAISGATTVASNAGQAAANGTTWLGRTVQAAKDVSAVAKPIIQGAVKTATAVMRYKDEIESPINRGTWYQDAVNAGQKVYENTKNIETVANMMK